MQGIQPGINLPPMIDIEFYRNAHNLADMTDQEVMAHFYFTGEEKGESPSPLCQRAGFIEWLEQNFGGKDILEIGPGCAPQMKGPGVKYYDRYTTRELQALYAKDGKNAARVPHIDYVGMGTDLSDIDQKFDLVFSCHNIEHIPDLIGHINSLGAILKEKGIIAFIVPNHKYTFDYYREPTKIAALVDAHINKGAARPPFSLWYDYAKCTTHNEEKRHWAGDHGEKTNRISMGEAYKEYNDMTEYPDFHHWVFEPRSFFPLIRELFNSGLLHFDVKRVYATPRNSESFNVILGRGIRPEAVSPHAEEICAWLRADNNDPLVKTLTHIIATNVALSNRLALYQDCRNERLLVWAWQQGRQEYPSLRELEANLAALIKEAHAAPAGSPPEKTVSRLLYAIWLERLDLRKFNPATEEGIAKLTKWFNDFGKKEYGLGCLDQ